LVISSPLARSDGVCHALRTLLAFIPPFRAVTVSKVSRSPILMPSGSIPEAFRSLMQKRIRSAVVAFDEPDATVGIPRFQNTGGHTISPFSARSRPCRGWGPWVLLECQIVCGWRETPFQRELSLSKLRRREVVAVFDPQAKIAFFDRSFCLPPLRTLRLGITVRPSPLVQVLRGGGWLRATWQVVLLASHRRPLRGCGAGLLPGPFLSTADPGETSPRSRRALPLFLFAGNGTC
jgi:hypothetical protein